ncbi:something about silencing protein 10 [Athalia rosae]|uniref:something about silencing protein 10 n=1 Tax=Athalia rosae TaxID=37344 RepID=UPI002034583E|nr:something about silencing protein 10 [Athalia rosae]
MNRKIKFQDADRNVSSYDLDDASDSEEDYSKEEKRLLEKVRKKRTVENFDSEDEIYGLQDEGDEDGDDDDEDDIGDDGSDSMKSDIEGLQEDDDLPDERAWGKKKKAFYSTDYIDQDYASTNQQDLEAAEIEEQEARNIQKRLAAQLDEADFGLDLIEAKENQPENEKQEEQIVKTDLSQLSKRQRQELVLKESPEFVGLVTDLRERLTEAQDILEPFLRLVKNIKSSDSVGLTFITTKYHTILNYCTNILYYLSLKANRTPVNSHPVIKRLAQYKQLLNQLESGQGTLLQEVVKILEASKKGQPLYGLDNTEFSVSQKRLASVLSNERVKRVKKNTEFIEQEIPTEELEIEEHKDNETEIDENDNDNENQEPKVADGADMDGKRAITYQIAKNKGLTPYRKKELRNPRVKHRNKYRKAKIRRKGAVREVRKEITRYGGELSGIKASVTKSIKLK